MNEPHPKRILLTIVTESLLEAKITQDVETLGAHGYTVTDARGKGSRGVRNAGWEQASNIRVEVVCDRETAEKIAAHMHDHYLPNYAMIILLSEVEVLRSDKF